MTKNDLARIIAEKHEITITASSGILATVFDTILDTAVKGDPYMHQGFGKFVIVERGARSIHYVNTGELRTISKKKILRLITSRRMNKRISTFLNADSIH